MPQGRSKFRSTPNAPMPTPGTDRKFSRMKKHAEKMRFERTGLLPERSEEYIFLKNWYKQMMNEHKEQKMKQNDLDMDVAKAQNREVARVFDGRTIGDGNVGILGFNTIWARGWTPTDFHPQAPWPTSRELREEGDERHTSNYGRFLPIPRVPGNKTVVYKQKSWVTVEPFDAVMPVPKLYGMVNVNMFGFFDTEVDHDGVPYDDHDLPGEEYVLKRDRDGLSTQSKGVVAEGNAQTTTASSMSSNIPALNPGKSCDGQLKYEDDAAGDIEATKKGFFGPLYDVLDMTPSARFETRPDALGFTDQWKTKGDVRVDHRTEHNVDQMHQNGSPIKSSKRVNVVPSIFNKEPARHAAAGLSPGSAFRLVNSAHQQRLVDRAGMGNVYDGLESPIEFRKISSFSSGKPRPNRPAPLKLKTRRNARVVQVIEHDDDDQDDGGVKLN